MNDLLDIRIYTGPSQTEALQNAVTALREHTQFAILEHLTTIKFPKPEAQEISIQAWPKGRIFCADFELRWEKTEGEWRSLCAIVKKHKLHEQIERLGFDPYDGMAESFPSDPKLFFLWDKENTRLGRRLEYECIPAAEDAQNRPPQLQVKEYRDQYGFLVFWRYLEMRYEI